MNTQDYINELKNQLRKLPDEDREDAISYYFEYLAEAGPEGAGEAMERLGTPAELAAGIRADKAIQDFTEAEGAGFKEGVEAVRLAGLAAVPRTALAVFVTAIVIVVFFAVIISLFAVAVALAGAGAIAVFGGASIIFFDFALALFGIGSGLVVFGLGILFFRFSVWCSKYLMIAIAEVFNGIRHKREVRKNTGQNNSGQGRYVS